MNRRDFLLNSASFAFGSLFGLNGFSKAFAFGEDNNKSFSHPRIALIIDDIGYSLSRARKFLGLGVPLTFSVLPRLTYSNDLAEEIRGQGQEVMLHQPMEPYNSDLNPGPGALYVGDGAGKITGIIEENISVLPFAVGVNNHMGSRFTSCQREIKETLRVIKKSNLFFVDSLTTSRSMAYKTARRLHMASAYRNIFLDNRPYPSYIFSQLHKLKRHARKYGYAIGIGHPYPETAAAIGKFLMGIKESGVSFVHVSNLVHSSGAEDKMGSTNSKIRILEYSNVPKAVNRVYRQTDAT